nr:phosphate acyltransferase PlsX [Clostridia bacterium]
MKILLDAMGGDNAPDATIKGAVRAINQIEAEIILIGNTEIINGKVKELYGKNSISEISDRLSIKHTTESIEMNDIPTQAIKRKKDSSMVVGFNMLKNGEGDVFVSAGNSGALLTGATLLVGRIKGIDRPALAGILPAYKSRLMLIDSGSNTNCKPNNLLQFAQMSTIYLKNTFGIEKPRIGLLNIGTEENKGNELTKETYKLLKEKSEELNINFIGNIEGRDAFSGEVDAIVTDGFTGNVFLKAVEGLGKFVKRTLSESLKKNALSTIAALPALPGIKRFAKTVDYKEYGGALFLGVKKPVVKAHGSSDEKLFEFTIKQAEQFVKNRAVEMMIEEFQKTNLKNNIENNIENDSNNITIINAE